MPAIRAICEVPLVSLAISEAQVRIRGVQDDIEDLANSIRLHGLLEPIVVCPNGQDGAFDVLMGQRRVLAHRLLRWDRIMAAIIDQPVDVTTARILSLTENLVRHDLDSRDVIDACTALYRKYGSAKLVAAETGLPYNQVLRHVKYDRLKADLRSLVDDGRVNLDLALKVQDVVPDCDAGTDSEARAIALALSGMTGAQQKTVLTEKKSNPRLGVDEVLQAGTATQRPRQIIVTLSPDEHRALQGYAKRNNVTQDQAAKALLAAGLGTKHRSGPARRS